MPFLLGALVTAIFFQTSSLGTFFSSGTIAEVQAVSVEVNRTRIDALFQKLWKEREGQVWMSKEEAQMVVQYLEPGQTMWEWGSGGSTTFFSHFVSEYYSVEHDEVWFNTVKEQLTADPVLSKKVSYQHVASVPYERVWPGPPSIGANYAQYIRAVPEDLKVDRFLVDGRARPQCAIEALFHFRDPQDSILFLHDFWDTVQRGHYKLVLLLYEMIDTVLEEQSLVVLRPKPDWRERLARFAYPEWWVGATADDSATPVQIIRVLD
ncbi:hypothetical protein KFL_004220050 [Klebsormidium nitens]|uniref:Class I SAM-dependent methyltransferase n=1 Tax=Klebsormidium nitens TaxID=105231 RepID=A0A1Y1II21_KLENI|nr:hypothetical protein KFL_004220050 [Klebsormidium nitens]|eukprot:GAQ88366.1 hypothetical protein KFL_004220050 [Klebsormidium nitens]